MNELSSVDRESLLVCLVSDSIPHFRTEHHLVATHEVEHYVFQLWLESLWVNQVEVDLVVGSNLDSLVAFDKVDETSDVQLVVLLPELVDDVGVVFILLFYDFEKHDLAGRSGDEGLVVDEEHLTKVLVSHLFEFGLLGVVTGDHEGLTLSIERVDLIVIGVVEALVWEILG